MYWEMQMWEIQTIIHGIVCTDTVIQLLFAATFLAIFVLDWFAASNFCDQVFFICVIIGLAQ
jgi:hypothetical protein